MIKVIQGNCVETLEDMEPESVDVIVTSPPYNNGTKYGDYNDNMTWAEYRRFINLSVCAMGSVLKESGSLFLNIGKIGRKDGEQSFDTTVDLMALISDNFWLQNMIVWVKSFSDDEQTTYGHFRPRNSERLLNNNFEFILHLTPTNKTPINRLAVGVPYSDKSNIKRFGHKEDLRCAGNVWFIPYETTNGAKDGPCPFPVELPRRCIKLHGVREDLVVLDPFCGTGNTLLACKELGVNGIGIDLSERDVEIARKKVGL